MRLAKKIKRALIIASTGMIISTAEINNSRLENIICQPIYAEQVQNNSSLGDGSNELGFIPPPEIKLPPPPPSHMSSAESYIPYPPPPVTPQSRSEKKNPPSPPVLVAKIIDSQKRDLTATPNDINNLLKRMKQMVNVEYSSELKTIDEISANPDKNPILFKSTHYRFSFDDEQRQTVRKYLLNGGTIILNPGRGSRPALDSAILELEKILPESRIQTLGSDHPIFHSYYDLDTVKCQIDGKEKTIPPMFKGIIIDCRLVAIVSELGLDAGWAGEKRDIDRIYGEEDSQKLGANILAYASAMRAWQQNTVHTSEFIDKENSSKQSSSTMSIAQIVYNGEWKTRHTGLSSLLKAFNEKTEIPVKFKKEELRLSDKRIFDFPIIYITGHENFNLDSAEVQQLRQYLQKGGLLFAEACCGRLGFDSSFRKQIALVIPGSQLEKISLNNQIFSLPNRVQQAEITPALRGKINQSLIEPQLEGIKIDNHYAVIYSKFALQGGWELSQNPYALGYNDSSSIHLGENILEYAVTQ